MTKHNRADETDHSQEVIVVHSYVESPIGPLLLTGEAGGLNGLYLAQHVRKPLELGERDDTAFAQVTEQLQEYFAGRRQEFDLPLRPKGTPFQLRVWQRLAAIGYGKSATYGEVARELGSPNAARAVGAANGRNPISIIVPCHRVIGSNGSLTGYAGGLTSKQWLLRHELTVLGQPV